MRALIYHRVSAADHGQSIDVGLERLRRHVTGRGWEVVAAISDVAPRQDTVRPGYRRARNLLAPGVSSGGEAIAPAVVVVLSLHRLFPSSHAALLDLGAWLAAGRHLVAIDDLIDTTRPEDGTAWRLVIRSLAAFESARHQEATLIGMLRSQLARHGRRLGAGRPLVAVDLLELQRLYAEGLSRRQMQRALGRGGAPAPSYGTIRARLQLLAAAGRLDHEAHRAAREARRA